MARTNDSDSASTEVPEADRLEQEQPTDPTVDDDEAWSPSAPDDVDEADRLEQAQAVVGDPDEEYTPDPP